MRERSQGTWITLYCSAILTVKGCDLMERWILLLLVRGAWSEELQDMMGPGDPVWKRYQLPTNGQVTYIKKRRQRVQLPLNNFFGVS